MRLGTDAALVSLYRTIHLVYLVAAVIVMKAGGGALQVFSMSLHAASTLEGENSNSGDTWRSSASYFPVRAR
jgi:hypothetical protein